MSEFSVVFNDVRKNFGAVRAVDGVNLSIPKGEFFTLLGASGSGKTTLLRLMGGFEEPDSGVLYIDGKDMAGVRAYKRPVHTVFQDYALFPHMSVFENVAFALRIKRISGPEIRKRVGESLDLVRMPGFEKRLPSQLSGGQKQRVALARAIVDHPSVLLLDEPLSALDAKVRSEVREELKRLQRQTKITFVYVTHDQEEALTLSDRMAVMHAGKVIQAGTPAEVYENPVDLRIASFIGKANFMKDGKGTIMVRPENLILSRDPADKRWKGKIAQIQFLGPATEYLVQTPETDLRALLLHRRGAPEYREGEEVYLSWKPEDARVFSGP